MKKVFKTGPIAISLPDTTTSIPLFQRGTFKGMPLSSPLGKRGGRAVVSGKLIAKRPVLDTFSISEI